MAEDDNSSSFSRLIAKLTITGIVVGTTIFLLFEGNWIQEHQSPRKVEAPLAHETTLSTVFGSRDECNIFDGEWVPNPLGPSYTNDTCSYIDIPNDCLGNGRPDTGYLYWKWKPYDCDATPLDAVKFMSSMRHKSWAFIGDSIVRNQLLSLVCMLSKVEKPILSYSTVKSRTYYFPSHNLTLATVWAPFLVKFSTGQSNEIQVDLDTLDEEWTKVYHIYDYVLIAAGQWFLKKVVLWEQGQIIGCHDCAGSYEEIGIDHPYRKTLEISFDFITSSEHKPLVFFRTWTPQHFEDGEWYNGGVCDRTRPYKEGEFTGKLFDQLMRNIEVEEYEKAVAKAMNKGIRMQLLDTFHLSLMRPDGHPGPYRRRHPFSHNKTARVQYDCLHSCVPGPADTWNDLMVMELLNAEATRSSEFESLISM